MLVLLLGLLWCTPAAAADFEPCADALYNMGLFQGTDLGYELDQPATRIQALIMLIRLMGQEDEALASNYEFPYHDVPAWAAPYVGYAFRFGLTDGMSATSFGPNEACTAQMYATFLLRALGYDDLGARDFTYDDAVDFALERDVVDTYCLPGEVFLRDNMVAMSYTALAADPKDGAQETLLERLCADNSVDSTAALPLLTLFAAYRNCVRAAERLNSRESVELTTSVSAALSLQDATILARLEQTLLRQRLGGENPAEAVYCLTVEDRYFYGSDSAPQQSSTAMLYRDGQRYALVEGRILQSPYPLTADPIGINLAIPPLCAITELTSRVSTDGRTLYTFHFSRHYMDQMERNTAPELGDPDNFSLNSCLITYVLDGNMDLAAQYLDQTADTAFDGLPCQIVISSTTELTAADGDVVIAFPF